MRPRNTATKLRPGEPFAKISWPAGWRSSRAKLIREFYLAGAQLAEQRVILENLPFFLMRWGVHDNSLTGAIKMKRVFPTARPAEFIMLTGFGINLFT